MRPRRRRLRRETAGASRRRRPRADGRGGSTTSMSCERSTPTTVAAPAASQRCLAHARARTHVEHAGARQRDRRACDEQSRDRCVDERRAPRPARGRAAVVVLVHPRERRVRVGDVARAARGVFLPPAQFVVVAHRLFPPEARGHAEQAQVELQVEPVGRCARHAVRARRAAPRSWLPCRSGGARSSTRDTRRDPTEPGPIPDRPNRAGSCGRPR